MSFLFPSSTITFAAALRDLSSKNTKARAAAAQALGDVTDPTEQSRAIEGLILALDDERPEVRGEAAGSLGTLRSTGAIPGLVKRLDDGVAGVRQTAAIALGSIAHADAFAPLLAALREGPADLRYQAATSLAEIDGARAFEPLVAALGDADPQVVSAAALALGAINDPRAIAQLAPVLEHAKDAVRFDAAYALAELGDPAGRAVLVGALADPERAWDAVTGLATLATTRPDQATEVADLLGRALVDRKVPPEATVVAAGTVLRVSPTSAHEAAARRVLLAGLDARKVTVRGLAVEQLGAAGGVWAREPLEQLARSGKGAELGDSIASALAAIAARTAGGAA